VHTLDAVELAARTLRQINARSARLERTPAPGHRRPLGPGHVRKVLPSDLMFLAPPKLYTTGEGNASSTSRAQLSLAVK